MVELTDPPPAAGSAAAALEPETLFRALADPTRLGCLLLLERRGELCVCEFITALALPQPKISRHLAHLRESGIVLDRRQGLWVHYRIHPELPAWAREVIRVTAEAFPALPAAGGGSCDC